MRSRFPAILFLLAMLVVPATSIAAARIVGPEELRARVFVQGGVAVLDVDGQRWEMITDPTDDALSKLGDGSFHPMDLDEVRAALDDLRHPAHLPDLTVYVLPFPRRGILESSCHGDTIYLSPGIRNVPAAHVHLTVAHEVGHVVQHELAPLGSHRFDQYRTLRGLDPVVHHDRAAHADRPAEIFAEDFRVLLGGDRARDAGALENPSLSSPDDVAGLRAWFQGLLRTPVSGPVERAATSFPNPFRAGQATLQVRFQSKAASAPRGTATIHDVLGRRVATLHHPTLGSDDAVTFRWDGRDDAGRRVASGIFLVRWSERPELGAARVQVVH